MQICFWCGENRTWSRKDRAITFSWKIRNKFGSATRSSVKSDFCRVLCKLLGQEIQILFCCARHSWHFVTFLFFVC